MVVGNMKEEDIEKISEKAIKDVTESKGTSSWNKEPSKAEAVASRLFYDVVQTKIEELINSEEYQKKAREEAERIIEDMKKKTHEKLVDTISGYLSMQYVDPYGGIFKAKVTEVVHQIMDSRY